MSPLANRISFVVLTLIIVGVAAIFFARSGSPFDASSKRKDMLKYSYITRLVDDALKSRGETGKFPVTVSGGRDYFESKDADQVQATVVYRKISNNEFEVKTRFTHSSEVLENWLGRGTLDFVFVPGDNILRFDVLAAKRVRVSWREW